MTQAPTPGPLDSESVKLLVKGDLLLTGTGVIVRFVREDAPGYIEVAHEKGFSGWHADECAFIGRPDADGWLNIDTAPKDGSRFESQDRTNYKRRVFTNTYWYVHPAVQGFVTEEIDCTDYEFEPTHWRPVSLAPTAPVEASGSERDTAVSILQAAVRSFDGGDTTNLNGVLDDILDALRPQPSEETREAVARIVDPEAWALFDRGLFPDLMPSRKTADAILARQGIHAEAPQFAVHELQQQRLAAD